MILGLLHQFHYEDQSESSSLALSNLFGATLQKHCYISNWQAAILTKKNKINNNKKRNRPIKSWVRCWHFLISGPEVIRFCGLSFYEIFFWGYVLSSIQENQRTIKTTKMSYLEYYILSIFCTTLHYFYLFTRQALSQLLFYPLCISFEFIHFILIVGFLHSVKCLAKRCKYRITV